VAHVNKEILLLFEYKAPATAADSQVKGEERYITGKPVTSEFFCDEMLSLTLLPLSFISFFLFFVKTFTLLIPLTLASGG